ncbi:hypothetical protein F5887DRAFT_1084515 [Amanita rubescens]|nr:hypothetical protein F5887DRAFT_1084515 [Amanita rubescens]
MLLNIPNLSKHEFRDISALCNVSMGVLFGHESIDVIHFIKVRNGEVVGPTIVWIGVAPETLLSKDTHTVAHGCLDLLKEFKITDVKVSQSKPLKLIDNEHLTVNVCGLSIAAQATPQVQGTGGLYLAEGSGNSKKVLLVTADHVLFPNDNHACKDACS